MQKFQEFVSIAPWTIIFTWANLLLLLFILKKLSETALRASNEEKRVYTTPEELGGHLIGKLKGTYKELVIRNVGIIVAALNLKTLIPGALVGI